MEIVFNCKTGEIETLLTADAPGSLIVNIPAKPVGDPDCECCAGTARFGKLDCPYCVHGAPRSGLLRGEA